MKKAYRWCCGLFGVCFALAAVSVLLQTGWLLPVFLTAGIWLLLRRPLPHFTSLLFLVGLALRVIVLLLLHPPLQSDFRMLFEAAHSLLSGDFSFQQTVYFSLWGYQSAFVVWEAFWLRLWDSPFCLELVNAVLAAGTSCLLYRLSREWVGRRAAQTAALLFQLLPFSAIFHTVLSNQIPSAFFLTLGLWLLVGEDCRRLGFRSFPLAGLALQAGNLLRSEGAIFLAAVLAWAAFRSLQQPQELRRLFAGLAALLVVYFGVHMGADALLRASGVSPYGLENRDPDWKIVIGLNPETRGGYSDGDWALIGPTLDENRQLTERSHAVQDALIAERLEVGPCALLHLLSSKIHHLWVSDGLCWALGHLREFWPGEYAFAQQFDRGLFFLALGLAAAGLPASCRNRVNAAACLPYFVFFAAYCAFLLVEVQPRYAYLPQMYIFTASAFGLERVEGGQDDAENHNCRPLPQ